jgi:hypothetical protein
MRTSRRFAIAGVAAALALVALFGVAGRARAIGMPYAISFTGGATVGATCATSQISFLNTVTGNVGDAACGGLWDCWTVGLYDANGVLLNSTSNGVFIGTTDQTPYALELSGVTARPVTVRLIDSTTFGGTTGPVIASATIDPASIPELEGVCGSLPYVGGGSAPPTPGIWDDGRINPHHGDDYAILMPARDDHGDPSLQVWCLNSAGEGYFGGEFSQADLSGVPAMPPANTEVLRISACRVPVVFYVLTTGAYQVNIGPDAEGKVAVVIFSGLPPSNVHFQDFSAQ